MNAPNATCEIRDTHLVRPAYPPRAIEQTQCPPYSVHKRQFFWCDVITLVAEVVYRISQPGEEKHVECLPRKYAPDDVVSIGTSRGEPEDGDDEAQESGIAYDTAKPPRRERDKACIR